MIQAVSPVLIVPSPAKADEKGSNVSAPIRMALLLFMFVFLLGFSIRSES